VWWVKDPLDTNIMRTAAQAFVGMKDFGAFAQQDKAAHAERIDSLDEPKSTLVLIERIDVIDDAGLVLVVIEGSHFLWKMVRRIVGVLVEIGKGALDAGAGATLLASDSDVPARLTAPASGLFLERVFTERSAAPRSARSAARVTSSPVRRDGLWRCRSARRAALSGPPL
jgi:tRNA pseudouridine38-40 synthase